MLGFGGKNGAAAAATKAGAAAAHAVRALQGAEARREAARKALGTATDTELEELAGELAKAEALLLAYRARAEAAEAAAARAVAEAEEARFVAAEAATAEAFRGVQAGGAKLAAKARAFLEELTAEAAALDRLANEGEKLREALPVERQGRSYSPRSGSAWCGLSSWPPDRILRRVNDLLTERAS